jgi:DNA topoisomerase I
MAKKLKKKMGTINDVNNKNLASKDEKIKQIATAMFFIDKLALRVGNEKTEDEADTVGVTSLRVEHVKLHENNKITLNFLGKDSVPYTNTISIDKVIYNNVNFFMKDKDSDEQIFDLISSNDINKYLQELMKDLTAKVFRTFNASNLFQKELNKISKKYDGQEDVKKIILDEFSRANAKVAKMMNHQKNISSGYKKNLDKINDMLESLKKKLTKARRSKKKNLKTIDKLKEKIETYKSKKNLTKEMKNISLGTSKANYIDPRITVAFMKKHDLDVSKLFSKALRDKFKWAFDVDEKYKF